MSSGGIPSHRIWVTAVIDKLRNRTFDRPLLLGCLTLGMIPVLLTFVFFALTARELTLSFAIAHLLAITVPFVGVSAIWYWDSRVFPRFVSEVSELAAAPERVRQVADTYKQIFVDRYLWFALPWSALIIAVITFNVGYFETFGIEGVDDPAFVVYLLFAAWWGLITGIGFHGAITAIRAIRAIGNLEFEVDPLHPDGLGGLSSIGEFAIWTTMLISIGSLTLPLAFILGTAGGYSPLVYLAVGIYVTVILVSFVYPTLYINRRAQSIRDAELEQRRTQIRRLQTQAQNLADREPGTDEVTTMDEMAKRLEIQRLRDEFNEYANINLYPLSVGILLRLASSVLLPIVFILFEALIGRVL